jgi:iron complex outermembrane recepter protein
VVFGELPCERDLPCKSNRTRVTPSGFRGFRRLRRKWLGILVLAVSTIAPVAVRAQRANENAVTAASDAFGTVVGTQTVGLYSPTSARGFSPTQAGNLRIDGLYFDQQSQQSNPYLFSGYDMRVGIAAQSYAFPSPSGIADYKLRAPGDSLLASAVLIRGPLDVASAEIDAQLPVTNVLSIGLIAAAQRGFDYNYALISNRRALSLLLRFRLAPGTEVMPFVGYIHNTEWQEEPLVFADGVHPLPQFDEQHLPIQNWTDWRWNQLTAGVIARIAMGNDWSLRAGLFRSTDENYRNFNPLFLEPMPDGIADQVMDVAPGRIATSYSGDLRITRMKTSGNHRRELTFAVRGRHIERNFGGDSVTDLGPINMFQSVSIPEPPLVFSAPSLDKVQQSGVGINDIERWKDRASLSLGVLVTNYTRSVAVPGAPENTQHTTVALPTISFTLKPASALTLYGSYTRGLEDSPIAPASAVNRGEPPPATPTWQIDAGVRAIVQPHLQLLLGAFEVQKSYFGVDTSGIYANVGEISSKGVESSATWTDAEGLTFVAGAVWLWPEVTRQAAQVAATGSVPIGPVPGTINLNLDYAPHAWRGWGTSVQWTWLSARVETSDDRYRLPPFGALNVGIRYLLKLSTHQFSARLDVGNVTNAAALTLSSLYLATPQLGRNYTLTLAADL